VGFGGKYRDRYGKKEGKGKEKEIKKNQENK
jgi:hypothetical protein